MEISFEKQSYTDFDWFCVDDEDCIGHFTTAGYKRLPRSVESVAEDLEELTKYFQSLPDGRGYQVRKEDLEAEVPDGIVNDRYFQSFVAMADRGLFSYDIKSHLKPEICYFRVASPTEPLRTSDVPSGVRDILQRTRLTGRSFRNTPRISYEETLKI